MRRIVPIAAVLIALGFSSAVSAQDAAAPAAPPPPPPPRVEGSGEFAFVQTSGNSSTQSLGLNGEVFYRPAPWTFQAKAAFVRLESDDEVTAQSLALLFRGARDLTPRLALYAEYDFLHDTFAGIDGRNSVTGGLAFRVINSERQKFILSAGVGVTHEARTVGDDLTEGTLTQGALYSVKLSKTSEFSNEFGIAESLADSSNWRVANQASLSAAINTVFSLKLSNVVRYVNEPVVGFETTDTITSVALVAKF